MISGIIAIDKPPGISSAAVVARVKKALGVKKVGHTGTLDPFATGLMLCAINKATRISGFLLGSSKTYLADLELGIETDTFDITGKIVSRSSIHESQVDTLPGNIDDLSGNADALPGNVDALSGNADALPGNVDALPCNVETLPGKLPETILPERVKVILETFIGPQMQSPPIYSALKQNGIPLYKLARQGTPVQKPPRRIEIFSIELLYLDMPRMGFAIHCSSGTYIRTIAHDIGRKLGCGAVLAGLRRTETCGFSVDDALTLSQLEAMDVSQAMNHLIPMAEILSFMPAIHADDELMERIRFGRPLPPSLADCLLNPIDHRVTAGDHRLNPIDHQLIPGDHRLSPGDHRVIGNGLPRESSVNDRPGSLKYYFRVLDTDGELVAVVSHDGVPGRYKYCCVLVD
ncbi:MAG: tRNA pseudouridine(55) synthase TruB [Desulfamplus sp.]|nr:tRNA pseudouridine(55) synthase TruB [Desulfamplus sp.]